MVEHIPTSMAALWTEWTLDCVVSQDSIKTGSHEVGKRLKEKPFRRGILLVFSFMAALLATNPEHRFKLPQGWSSVSIAAKVKPAR